MQALEHCFKKSFSALCFMYKITTKNADISHSTGLHFNYEDFVFQSSRLENVIYVICGEGALHGVSHEAELKLILCYRI